MNCISRGRAEKCGKEGRVISGMGDECEDEDEDGVSAFGSVEDSGAGNVVGDMGGKAGTSDIVGADASGSSDGGRSDHVSVLVVAIAINLLYLLVLE